MRAASPGARRRALLLSFALLASGCAGGRISVDEAARRCGVDRPPAGSTWSETLQSWIIPLPHRTCAVDGHRMLEWPGTDPAVFDWIDLAPDPAEIRFSETAAYTLQERFSLERRMTDDGPAFFGRVRRSEMRAFLEEVSRRRLLMEAGATGSGEPGLWIR